MIHLTSIQFERAAEIKRQIEELEKEYAEIMKSAFETRRVITDETRHRMSLGQLRRWRKIRRMIGVEA